MSENLKRHMEELAAAKEEISQKAKHLQLLLAHTISLQEEERRRIAGELHDGISQLLLGALYETEAAKEALAHEPSLALEDLDRAQSLLEQTSMEMRRVIYDLRPPLLDDIGFIPALDRYVKSFSERTGIDVSLDITGKIKQLPHDSKLALYRISQEALHNIHKHAHTDHADIHIHFFDHQMQMTIRDQGIGFDPSNLDLFRLENLGLPGMQERAQSVGAHLNIKAKPGVGTTIRLIMGTQARRE
jgi:two-component system sensor histidine kinase DegS